MSTAAMPSASMKTATTVKAPTKTRLPERGYPSHRAAMIKAAESPRVQTGRWMSHTWRSMKSCCAFRASMEALTSAVNINWAMPKIRPSIIKAAPSAIECLMVEKSSAVRFKVVVVKTDIVVTPVRVPVVPSPAKTTKEADAKTQAETNSRRCPVQTWIPVPTGPHSNRRSIHQPRIVFRYVNDLWIDWFNHNRRSLLRYFFLRCRIQVSGILRTLSHYLHRIHYVLRLIYVRIAEGRRPGEVLVHIAQHRWKLRESFDTWIPGLSINFLA